MIKRTQRLVIGSSVLVAVVATIVVTAATASSKGHRVKLPATTAQTVPPQLGRIFKVLRGKDVRGHTAHMSTIGAQPLPAAVVKGMGNQPSVNPSAAVFVGGVYPTWIVPGAAEICLVVGAVSPGDVPSGVCGSIPAAEHGLALTSSNAAGTPVVLGLVPNGNATVKVTNTDGTTENVPVTNNVYEITSSNPSTVRFNEASGISITRHLAIPSRPPASAPAGSAAP